MTVMYSHSGRKRLTGSYRLALPCSISCIIAVMVISLVQE